jgi:hypothetical protein
VVYAVALKLSQDAPDIADYPLHVLAHRDKRGLDCVPREGVLADPVIPRISQKNLCPCTNGQQKKEDNKTFDAGASEFLLHFGSDQRITFGLLSEAFYGHICDKRYRNGA